MAAFVDGIVQASQFPYVFERLLWNSLKAAGFLVVLTAVIGLLEVLSGASARHYRTRGFAQDIFYLFWHRSRFFYAFFLASFFLLLEPRIRGFNLHLLSGLPFIPRCIVAYFIGDVVGYWYHRWQHANRFLWAFHTTHHSQEHLSFATNFRFHPVEDFLQTVLTFVPMYVIGIEPVTWVPLRVVIEIVTYIQHSQIRWRFGPLRYIFTTPTFHAIHHSRDPGHFNRNFAPTLALVDYIFGTAVKDDEYPQRTGLPDVQMPTLRSTLVTPFRLIHQFYFQHSERSGEPRGAAAAGRD